MKKYLLFPLISIFYSAAFSQTVCNPAGNVVIYSNYDGGVLNINVDVNIANLKIGIVSYEPVTVNLSGTYPNNVTEVRFAGYSPSGNHHCSNSPVVTTIVGAPAGTDTVIYMPASPVSNVNGYNVIICNYSCDTSTNQGGCNTPDQIGAYFLQVFGGQLRYHFTQYGCWNTSPYSLSSGGNCCIGAAPLINDSIVTTSLSIPSICAGNTLDVNFTSTGTFNVGNVYKAQLSDSFGNFGAPVTLNPGLTSSASGAFTIAGVIIPGGTSASTGYRIRVVSTSPVITNDPGLPIGISAPASATIAYPGTPYCPDVSSSQSVTQTGNAGGTYSSIPTGLAIDTVTGSIIPSTSTAGTYTVSYTVPASGDCPAFITSTTIAINAPFTATVTSDKTIICPGDSARVCATSGYSAYVWNTSQTDSCIYAALAGNYYVTVTDNGNCTASSNSISISVYPAQTVSTSANGDTLQAFNGNAYQWYFNGNPIGGATSDTYIAPQSGNYQVLVTDSNGCNALSNIITVNGISEIAEDEIQIYPNPASGGRWQLVVGRNLLGNQFEIFDETGRLVYKTEIKNQKLEIDFTATKGIYTLRMNSSGGSIVRKLIKL